LYVESPFGASEVITVPLKQFTLNEPIDGISKSLKQMNAVSFKKVRVRYTIIQTKTEHNGFKLRFAGIYRDDLRRLSGKIR
jgi:hypothetical protein